MSGYLHAIGVFLTAGILLLGILVDIGLLWRWFTRLPTLSLNISKYQRILQIPWKTHDVLVLVCLMVSLSLPAVLGSAPAQPQPIQHHAHSFFFFAQPLLIFAVMFGGMAFLVWRTHHPWRQVLGVEAHQIGSAIRAGILYGIAALPLGFLLSAVNQYALKYFGVDTPHQHVFTWLMDAGLSWNARALLVLIATVAGPITEELVFRGCMLPALFRKSRPIVAILVINLFFALIHFYPAGFLPLAAIGICFSLGMIATGSILTPIVMHMIFNTMSILLFILTPQLR